MVNIEAVLTEAILTEIINRYGISKEKLYILKRFRNVVYEYEKDQRRYILRISHSSHRTSAMIAGEIQWIDYLNHHGVSASKAIPSNNGKTIEVFGVNDADYFTIVAFEKAMGEHPGEKDFDGGLIYQMGQLIGRLHSLTKGYQPSAGKCKRPEWREYYHDFALKYLDAAEEKVREVFYNLKEYFQSLPQDRESYGLIHGDVHGGNFFLENGKITLFDFDESLYEWFIYDIAVALFYLIPHSCSGEESINNVNHVFRQLKAGYLHENRLDSFWFGQIPYFLKLREICLYLFINSEIIPENRDSWCKSFMENRKDKIQNHIPYVPDSALHF